jgi:preprotein translocase subunit SecF
MSQERLINFMAFRKLAAIISLILILISITSLATNRLQLGLDFTGGTLIEVSYQQAPELTLVRAKLQKAGFTDAMVQNFGADTDVLVRLGQAFDDQVGQQVLGVLQDEDTTVELQRSEYVGAQVGEELMEQGGLGLLLLAGHCDALCGLAFPA